MKLPPMRISGLTIGAVLLSMAGNYSIYRQISSNMRR